MQDANQPEVTQTELEEFLNQSINEGFVEVPILPEIANKAFLLANDKQSDANQMAHLLQSDPALAGHVMRIANSAAYTPMSNMASLQQAIARLGMTTISEIAISAVLNAKLFNTPGYEHYANDIWRQALATSLWAKEIAHHCQVEEEIAFLAGLIHSIGRTAVLQTLIDIAAQRNLPLDAIIVDKLEEKYWLKVSQMIVIRWNMPAPVIKTIQHLDTPDFDTTAAVVTAARYFADTMMADKLNDELDFNHEACFAKLNLDSERVQTLMSKQDQVRARLEELTV